MVDLSQDVPQELYHVALEELEALEADLGIPVTYFRPAVCPLEALQTCQDIPPQALLVLLLACNRPLHALSDLAQSMLEVLERVVQVGHQATVVTPMPEVAENVSPTVPPPMPVES